MHFFSFFSKQLSCEYCHFGTSLFVYVFGESGALCTSTTPCLGVSAFMAWQMCHSLETLYLLKVTVFFYYFWLALIPVMKEPCVDITLTILLFFGSKFHLSMVVFKWVKIKYKYWQIMTIPTNFNHVSWHTADDCCQLMILQIEMLFS